MELENSGLSLSLAQRARGFTALLSAWNLGDTNPENSNDPRQRSLFWRAWLTTYLPTDELAEVFDLAASIDAATFDLEPEIVAIRKSDLSKLQNDRRFIEFALELCGFIQMQNGDWVLHDNGKKHLYADDICSHRH